MLLIYLLIELLSLVVGLSGMKMCVGESYDFDKNINCLHVALAGVYPFRKTGLKTNQIIIDVANFKQF